MTRILLSKIIFLAAALWCLTPYTDPPLALLTGLLLSLTIGHPFIQYNHKATRILLQSSVVGLGFGMNLYSAAKAGEQGLWFTAATIGITLLLGILFGKILRVNQKASILISAGTAICGGSAIAAVSPVIHAKEEEMSVSLGTVFLLNAIALFLFPVLGHLLNLSQPQFGMWAAIAIHDTSSVVGASHKYGESALQIATTVKLERALWIIPLSLVISVIFKNNKRSIHLPWFIFLFIVAMAINTFSPPLHAAGEIISSLAKKGLTLTLFLIGAGLTRKALKNVGARPFVLGVILWVIISAGSLFVILRTVE